MWHLANDAALFEARVRLDDLDRDNTAERIDKCPDRCEFGHLDICVGAKVKMSGPRQIRTFALDTDDHGTDEEQIVSSSILPLRHILKVVTDWESSARGSLRAPASTS